MEKQSMIENLRSGTVHLGIELGSTRIKSVLITDDYSLVAAGESTWENQFSNEIWTYSLTQIWTGIQTSYANLVQVVSKEYGINLTKVASMGVSAMMHGYLPFDASDNLLVPFRTWRNTTTGSAAKELSELFHFNIPQRWSIAHLHQAVLNDESHIGDITYLTTLAGYVHWMLTGQKVIGIGDASGMFPVDSKLLDYDQTMIEQYDALIAPKSPGWTLGDILPKVLVAGESAGRLTPEGAKKLDLSGALEPGIPLCPPEGDAATGMVATHAITPRTGNVSAGTSIFAMIVLEKPLVKHYPEIDMVTTPTGSPVAMVHCNNCTNEINAWAGLLKGFLIAMGYEVDEDTLFKTIFQSALRGASDGSDMTLYNYLSGEPIAGLDDGRPIFIRTANSAFTFDNFMRLQLYSAVATLNMGLEILAGECVSIERLMGHGGFFKTPKVGQLMMSIATGVPVSVMDTAGEGGAWGMAILAAYHAQKENEQSLEDYLATSIFSHQEMTDVYPTAEDMAEFATFMERYKRNLAVERLATQL